MRKNRFRSHRFKDTSLLLLREPEVDLPRFWYIPIHVCTILAKNRRSLPGFWGEFVNSAVVLGAIRRLLAKQVSQRTHIVRGVWRPGRIEHALCDRHVIEDALLIRGLWISERGAACVPKRPYPKNFMGCGSLGCGRLGVAVWGGVEHALGDRHVVEDALLIRGLWFEFCDRGAGFRDLMRVNF